MKQDKPLGFEEKHPDLTAVTYFMLLMVGAMFIVLVL